MSNEKKNYGETLNLPKTDFPMRGNLPEREPFFLERMENMNVYEKALAKNKESGKNFILHDGPPYANGNIHLGHAFNKILKDICVRYKTMQGYYAPYIPGWDTHGLPIEKKVQKELGISKDEVGIPKFREICKNYALEQVELQEGQFKRLGGLGDFVYQGVTSNNNTLILLGAIPSALLAVAIGILIDKIQMYIIPRGIRKEAAK